MIKRDVIALFRSIYTIYNNKIVLQIKIEEIAIRNNPFLKTLELYDYSNNYHQYYMSLEQIYNYFKKEKKLKYLIAELQKRTIENL